MDKEYIESCDFPNLPYPPRSANGVDRYYRALMNKLYERSGTTLWDFPTLHYCYPEVYYRIESLVALYKEYTTRVL